MKEAIDVVCQPKVAAMIGIATIITSALLDNTNLALAGLIIMFYSAIWAWVKYY